jgi:hypothetical protein
LLQGKQKGPYLHTQLGTLGRGDHLNDAVVVEGHLFLGLHAEVVDVVAYKNK